MEVLKNQTLIIKNFGPINIGSKKPLDFKRCTVFIGDQGSGKSTVVKVFSTLTWLEKYITAKNNKAIKSINEFKNLLSQQNIPKSYFNKDTYIEYNGQSLSVIIKDDNIKISENIKESERYICPKIQYFPAERNLLSVISNIQTATGIPEMLNVLNREFDIACKEVKGIKFQDFLLMYYEQSKEKTVFHTKTGSEVELLQASSGLQSIYPLLFVSRYLKNTVDANFLERLKNSDDNRRQNVVRLISDPILKDKVYNYILSRIGNISNEDIDSLNKDFSRIINSCLIEIVEEPEQNLFPISQSELLKQLVTHTNGIGDKLIITTHSPYILSQLNNSIFAYEKLYYSKSKLKKKFCELFIPFNDIAAYKIENGKINNILDKSFKGINVLEIDKCSRVISAEFEKINDESI